MKLSLVIPVYNEEKTLPVIVKKIFNADLGIAHSELELIIVNDASTDTSAQIIQDLQTKYPQVKYLENDVNKGKSQTVKRGIVISQGELVVIQDADLEYNPENLKGFIELFNNSDVDVVYGNRFGKQNKVIYWQNYIGNTVLSIISGSFTFIRGGFFPRDMEVCYKMVKGTIFRKVAQNIISTSNFGFEPEFTARLARYRKKNGNKLKFRQLPIDYYPRSIAEGKHMKAFRDGFKALGEILRFNLFGL